MTELIMGIDPGLTGAVAVIKKETRELVDVFDIPIIEFKKKKNQIDIFSLAQAIDYHAKNVGLCVIEEVNAMPKQGVVSTFRFGYVTGCIHGVVASSFINIALAKPSVWKPALALSRDKDDSRLKATKLYPKEAHRWKRKKDDGRAEAVLLAWYGAEYS